LSGNIQDQLNNLSTRITNLEIVGTIIMSPLYDLQTTTNNKYLICNGQAVSRTTYSALFAKFETQFGVGNGTTTFNLPNYSAIFLRGMGNQTINGVNYGNYNSTYSPDQDSIQNHTHSGQSGSFLGTVNIQVSPSYRTGTGDSPNAYTFSNTGGMATGRINDNETKPVSMGIYYYVRT
jgi:microcystin-dependent protein